MKRFINGLALFLLLPWHSGAQGIPLDSILSHIRRNHPMLAEYRQRAGAWEIYAQGTTAWMAPMAGLGTFMTPYPGQNPEDMDKGALMVSVEQSIPNRTRAKAAQHAMRARAGLEEARGAQQWNMLRAEARKAVYNWTAADEQLQQLRRQQDMLGIVHDLTRIRYGNSQGNAASIFQVEAKQARLRNMITEAESMKLEAEAMLKGLMAWPEGMPFHLQPARPEFDILRLSNDTTQLHARRSDIRETEERIRQMRLEQTARELQRKPDYRLRFDHMQPLGQTAPAQFTAMAMVTIPIAPWSAGMYRSESAGMDREISAMEKGKSALLLDARTRMLSLAAQLNGLRNQLKGYEEDILPALQRTFDAVRIAWTEDRETLNMVLDAWENINMARSEYLEKKQRYYALIADYEKTAEN